MKTHPMIRRLLNGESNLKPSPEQEQEMARVKRRLTKFPRLKRAPNPFANRMAYFRHRFGL